MSQASLRLCRQAIKYAMEDGALQSARGMLKVAAFLELDYGFDTAVSKVFAASSRKTAAAVCLAAINKPSDACKLATGWEKPLLGGIVGGGLGLGVAELSNRILNGEDNIYADRKRKLRSALSVLSGAAIGAGIGGGRSELPHPGTSAAVAAAGTGGVTGIGGGLGTN
jgi:hypothetical protein